MSTIKVSCIDQTLSLTNTPKIASGGVGEDFLQVSFCPMWDGFGKTAIFFNDRDTVYYKTLDDTGSCEVPAVVMARPGIMYFAVYGTSGTIKRTSEILKYEIVEGALVGNTVPPEDPAQSVYDHIVELLAGKAPVASPAFTGTPTAPTPAAGTNTTQIATTAFVAAAVAALVDSAPETLDTLAELSAALGDDANFAATVAAQIASKANANHTHTADQVGARPATWMPTAEDVGARPATWMPTAEDVGAYPIYKSLEDIGCTTANTLQEVYTALPQGSVLIIDWCGKSVSAYSGTTFGNAMPANYGPLYLYKPGGTNGVGKFEFWAWDSSLTTVPYIKFVTNANSTWSETEWMSDKSEGLTLLGSVTSSSSVSITSTELAKHKGIVLQAECVISGTSAGDVKYIPKQLISSNAVIYTVGISAHNTTTAFGTMSVGVSNTAVTYKAKVESGVSCSAVKVYYYD